jgi:anti-sigma B factor antagonist
MPVPDALGLGHGIPGHARAAMKQRPAVTILTGELDLQASRSLGQRLNEEVGAGVAAADVILDLSSVSFIDSSALGVIVQADQRLGRQGRGLALVAPEGSAAASFVQITHVDRSLRIGTTRDEAEAKLTAEPADAPAPADPATPS